jgi:hypothetical protein
MNKDNKLAFRRINYIIMLVGVLVLILGFTLMSIDKEEYGFGVLGLTIGPIVVLSGFAIELLAILHTPKTNK